MGEKNIANLREMMKPKLDEIVQTARAPLIDKLEKALEINRELVEVLKHAVNWGHGFEGTGHRPTWLTEAEEVLAKGDSR